MPSLSLILAALLCIVSIAGAREGLTIAPMIGGIWLTFGVGHGLFDAVLAARSWNVSFRVAFGLYAAFSLVAGLVAFVFPYLALVLHAAVSAFHFGQAEWGEPRRERKLERGVILVWGLALIVVMIMGPWTESRQVIDVLLQGDTVGLLPLLGQIRGALLVGFGALGFLASIWLGRRMPASDNRCTQRAFETLLLYALFLTLPLWLSFVLYLSLWHGLRSLEEDISPEIRRAWQNRSGRPALIVAVVAASLTTALIVYFGRQITPATIRDHAFAGATAFAFLIAVTFPHAVVMAGVTRRRSYAA